MGVQKQCLLRVADTQRAHLDRQKQCLLRVTDTHAKGFVITNPMLAKSKRRLCKHQLFVIKPTRHRTSEPQSEAYFSPSRAVISRDFQGAICSLKAYLIHKINIKIYPQLVAIEKAQKGQAHLIFYERFL